MAQQKVNTPLFDFAKTQGLYHFDIDQPDDDDIIFKPKFRANFEIDIDNFVPDRQEFNLSNQYTSMIMQEWINLKYDYSRFNTKMKTSNQTPVCEAIAKLVPWDEKYPTQSFITRQEPGQYVPYHCDVLASSGIAPDVAVRDGYRVLVFMTDWQPGQFMIWGTTIIQKWKAGWILAWPAVKYPHGTANCSFEAGFRMRLSGVGNEEFYNWLQEETIIDV